jgi:hypothetical protein
MPLLKFQGSEVVRLDVDRCMIITGVETLSAIVGNSSIFNCKNLPDLKIKKISKVSPESHLNLETALVSHLHVSSLFLAASFQGNTTNLTYFDQDTNHINRLLLNQLLNTLQTDERETLLLDLIVLFSFLNISHVIEGQAVIILY